VGSAVVAAVARWSLAELRLVRLQLEHAVANVGSCKVASNAGFVLEGILRSASRDSAGVRHDDHVHGRLATDPVPGPVAAAAGR
jgi:RimJ/RimL family protein N-acetyltransferase